MEIDMKYLETEACKFRGVMGDKRYTVEQCSDALKGLLTVYVNTKFQTEKEKKRAALMMDAICLEHDKRLELRLLYNI
jgi:hypothetical protein